MKTNIRRWFSAPTLALAGLAATGFIAGVAGPAHAASAAPATAPVAHTMTVPASSVPASSVHASSVHAAAPAPGKPGAPAPVPTAKALHHDFQLQSTGWWCGPSATRVALSAQGKTFTQDQVAKMLGTTEDGTPSANDVTRVLNQQLGKGKYHTVEISGAKASQAQVDKLKADVVSAINAGKPVVANIAGTMTDDNGDVHSYEGGHYLPIVGYSNGGATVKIADSADTVGSPYYDISTDKVANWIATRGYAA